MTRTTIDKPEIDVKILRVNKQLQDLEQKKKSLEDLANMGGLFTDGEVIIFDKTHGGRKYTYVALFTAGYWYVTGTGGANKRYTWTTMVEQYFSEGVTMIFRVIDVEEVKEVTAGIRDYKSLADSSRSYRRGY